MKERVAFDIDVATVEAWEKSDPRKKEAREFFNFLRKHKFNIIVSKHTLEQVEDWKDKQLALRIVSLFKEFCNVVEPIEAIKKFEERRKIKIRNFAENFAKQAKIKLEDALAIIIYSLLKTKYFVTFNKKHLRNKYAKLKEIGWKLGIEIPEIMLPNEFVSLFSKLFEENFGSLSSKKNPKFNRIFNFFYLLSHNFKCNLELFKAFSFINETNFDTSNQICLGNIKLSSSSPYINLNGVAIKKVGSNIVI
ncbi:MAG: hypothetical protein QXQ77_03205 [Candidatus Aenigmatarchaeota archaeon]